MTRHLDSNVFWIWLFGTLSVAYCQTWIGKGISEEIQLSQKLMCNLEPQLLLMVTLWTARACGLRIYSSSSHWFNNKKRWKNQHPSLFNDSFPPNHLSKSDRCLCSRSSYQNDTLSPTIANRKTSLHQMAHQKRKKKRPPNLNRTKNLKFLKFLKFLRQGQI